MKIRMKHDDPDARISLAQEGPDNKGGFLFDERAVNEARSHGFRVVHLNEEGDEEPEQQDEPEKLVTYSSADAVRTEEVSSKALPPKGAPRKQPPFVRR